MKRLLPISCAVLALALTACSDPGEAYTPVSELPSERTPADDTAKDTPRSPPPTDPLTPPPVDPDLPPPVDPSLPPPAEPPIDETQRPPPPVDSPMISPPEKEPAAPTG